MSKNDKILIPANIQQDINFKRLEKDLFSNVMIVEYYVGQHIEELQDGTISVLPIIETELVEKHKNWFQKLIDLLS